MLDTNQQEVRFLEEKTRQQEIREKGFNFGPPNQLDYGKIKVGVKTLEDAVLNLGSLRTINRRLCDKRVVLKALAENDLPLLREVSNFFYRTSGIYQSACNYVATMYRYDWYIVPEVYKDSVKEEEVVKEFARILNYLDNSYVKKNCADIALKVVLNGAYYGYIVDGGSGLMLQELPASYCRARFSVGNKPAVEFNMRFFDEKFSDVNYRIKVLKMFPEEFAKGYVLYKQGKLVAENGDRESGWYLLDPEKTIKFSFNNGDLPLFVNAIPSIIDLDAAQDLDRRKQMQKLLKILVQKLPMDKNGDLIFDIDESRDIHNNAVEMLQHAIGMDVLTTFTDVEAIDLADKATTTSKDELEKVERGVFNALGITKNLFNSEGNLSMNNSILDDEGAIRYLFFQFVTFYDRITQSRVKDKKRYNFRLYMLETTQYNYKDLSKMYKEQVQMGYSKMLPQIALGHSQSAIINTAYFENEILHLSEIMIPPLMSSTLNAQDILGGKGQTNTTKTQNTSNTSSTGGRPEKPDNQKSEKTIQNKESAGQGGK